MNELTDQQLLCAYAENRSDTAFAEVVQRHVDLVYSAALRMVCDAHAAKDVTQGVFVLLAEQARQLSDRPTLAGWLHCTARNLAAKTVRSDVRRRAREQEAAVMNELLSAAPDTNWEDIAPHLDEGLGELNELDREALLLRYFKNQDLRTVGTVLGISDDAAQKRVSRAVDRLREFFSKRGVTIGASGLVVVISAHAVQAAPIGLATAISAAAGAGVVTTSTLVSTTKAIAMTTLQKTIVTISITAALAVGIYEARQNSKLREQVQLLEQQQAPLAEQLQQLQRERDAATNRLASLADEVTKSTKTPSEVLKLRGEVGALRQEKKLDGEKSALNKLTADPESRKLMRDQQKMGMSMLYGDFAKRMKLTPEVKDKFNDLLADSVMDNVDLITQSLHDGKSPAEVDQIFSAAELALQGKVQELLGDDGLAKYKDYTQNLASHMSADGFGDKLTGDKAEKDQKQKQLRQVLQEEIASALKNAGLPSDYQVVPMLNFRNIASETIASKNLELIDGIYANVATRSSSFLSPEEVASFQTFRTNALNGNRSILSMNRKLMAPLSK